MITVKIPKLAEECRTPTDAYEVTKWPEFIAFCTRLGLSMDRPLKRLVIDIDWNTSIVSAYMEQVCRDTGPVEVIE